MASITKRGNSYSIRVSAGYDATGKQIFRSKTWKPPEGMTERKAEKEVQNVARDFEKEVKEGRCATQKIKFGTFAEKWFSDYAELQLRPKTISRYRGLMVRIEPELGYLYLDQIRPLHLNAFYKKLSQTKKDQDFEQKVDLKAYLKSIKMTQTELATIAQVSTGTTKAIISGKHVSEETARKVSEALKKKVSDLFSPVGEVEYLSSQTILHYHRLISVILQTAVEWQYIPVNYAEKTKPPKVTRQEALYLDDKQAIRLLEYMETQPVPYKTAVEILLYTGMRRGELLGLKWEDIDFNSQTITIRRSIQYLPDKGVFEDETKNKSSNRVIRVPAYAIASLQKYLNWIRRESFKIGASFDYDSRVFVSPNLTPMHPDTLTSWFCGFIKTTDLPQIHIHSLRHTNATLQIANGVSVTTVAGNLGHSTANTTTKVYAHAIQSAQAKSAEIIDALLAPAKRSATG